MDNDCHHEELLPNSMLLQVYELISECIQNIHIISSLRVNFTENQDIQQIIKKTSTHNAKNDVYFTTTEKTSSVSVDNNMPGLDVHSFKKLKTEHTKKERLAMGMLSQP